MIKILFGCRNFDQMAGGIERISSKIMNEMINRGHQVTLLTWDHSQAKSHYKLNSNIKWIKLNLGSPKESANWVIRFKRQKEIRKIIREINPNIVIGFQVGTFAALRSSLFGLNIPIIAAERNSPDLFKYTKNNKFNRFLASLSLFFADKITVQFNNYKKKYPFFLRSKILTIPNPVNQNNLPIFPNEIKDPPKRIINVGRLSFQKNQIFLIDCFSLISHKNPDWILTIVGEGEYRKKIEDIINKKNLSNKIELIGAVKNVDYWLKKSSILAFPSLWEGFPNALVEAFRQGVPAIGLTTTSGVNQLINHKKNGLLVNQNENQYADAMQYMINNIDFRIKAGRYGNESIKQYNPEFIFNQWEELFLGLSKANK